MNTIYLLKGIEQNRIFCRTLLQQFHNNIPPFLRMPTESLATKWQEQLVATDSNLKKYGIEPKEQLPSGHTLLWRIWRTGRHSGSETSVGLPGEENLYVRHSYMRTLNHILTSCKHFRERPIKDNIAKMVKRSMRWLSAVAARQAIYDPYKYEI